MNFKAWDKETKEMRMCGNDDVVCLDWSQSDDPIHFPFETLVPLFDVSASTLTS